MQLVPQAGPNPPWYKRAVIYQLHVRAFYDANGDGIGDLQGVIEKLDYLQELGVTAIWLLPFYPSPLRDAGYDTSDYCDVHPDYGTLADAERLIEEAHRRGMRVVTEMVLNHTSDQHPWFQRARRAPLNSDHRQWYVWSDDPHRYNNVRIIFPDFETSNWTWDPIANAYYWHRFYSHQPDLNFDHPPVQQAVLDVVDFWFERGVDGMRLDAVPYLFEREGTSCENLPETHAFLKKLRDHVDARYNDRMLLAEANMWPEDAIPYFGDGDECHMCFHFPVMPRLFMALRQEDRFPIVDILEQTPPIPEGCQWATFLRNHDELTLEMVTDEERDFMRRSFARDPRARINLGIRRRLAPLLDKDRRSIELMNVLLFTLPGTPIVYYGDEIGMGDNIYLGDRDAVRTPMQWNADRNAGFSRANPQQLYLPVNIDPEYRYESVNVEAQTVNSTSLWWWMKRLTSRYRDHARVLGDGELSFLQPENTKVLAFLRQLGTERLVVLGNLSRHAQHVQLDLSAFAGLVPEELFGRSRFPPIGERPYPLSLGPHDYLMFRLLDDPDRPPSTPEEVPRLDDDVADLDGVLDAEGFPSLLARVLPTRRWFRARARTIDTLQVVDRIPMGEAILALVDVSFHEGEGERSVLPLRIARAEEGPHLAEAAPRAILARLTVAGEDALLIDALEHPTVAEHLLSAAAGTTALRGRRGWVQPMAREGFAEALAALAPGARALGGMEQANTAVACGEELFLKVYRALEPGPNPDVEIGLALTEAGFPHAPTLRATLTYHHDPRTAPQALAVVQTLVPNEGDAWNDMLHQLAMLFERVVVQGIALPRPGTDIATLPHDSVPEAVSELVGPSIPRLELLGTRTAELHRALATAFPCEPVNAYDQRALYQSVRTATRRLFQQLRRVGEPPQVLELEGRLLEGVAPLVGMRPSGQKIRVHGDYHLGQALWTGRDYVIIDFEGEPRRPLSERRLTRSPIRDVAGMIRSLHYAASVAEVEASEAHAVRTSANREMLRAAAEAWVGWASRGFLLAWLEGVRGAAFLPDTDEGVELLLRAHLVEKAVYEVGYELEHRPAWTWVPMRGLWWLTKQS